ncbi:hypothetical protein ACE193_15040 [Bernardetia sp. OM2101]|uniref:hypothetical protein n=1 Tax=Bernardetia sp. OM2101 TaxID=3344876 RepID=UPI0035D03356
MNKNLFIYSFKYLAVLLALVTFSSCERDEFTEQDAFDLQQAQLNAQDAREQAALAAQDQRVMDMAQFRRSMDSLTRLNSGGKVFYTVNVVPGGSSAFSSGRFEEVEGLDGATVTVSQLGGAIVEQKTTVGGLASFEMYSGEVTVNVEAPNHTDLNYTANLTPDGGVPNGALLYVGNVVPVFDDPNNPGAGSEENLATVKGFAFAELDITEGNNQEESVPDGTKVRAFIDVQNPAFKAKYIDQANDEGVNNGGQPTKSGFIQRFAYEEAASTTGTTVTTPLNNDTAPDGGEYSITIGATASGLPIMMKFDDFAADRTYFFDDNDTDFGGPVGFGPGAKRFIYTQNTELVGGVANQAPTPISSLGDIDLGPGRLRVNFDFAQNEATATAGLTGGDAVASVTITDGGYYYVAPTVTFSAPTTGTTATGTAIMEAIPTAANGGPAAGTVGAAARDRGMLRVAGVNLNGVDGIANNADDTRGSGYTSNPTVTFTRFSYTGRDAAGVPVANGTGSVAASSSTIKYIRIIDGGFGMTGAGTSTGVGNYTGTVPGVVFNNNVVPNGGGGVLATANLIVDTNVGTATEVQITDGGDGYSDAVAITFNYGQNAVVSLGTIGGADNIFAQVAGELRWNNTGTTRILTVANAAGSEVAFAGGDNYSFVPSISLTGLVAPAGATLPTFAATVVGGVITQIEMQGATSGWTTNPEYTGTINISANPEGVAISAEGFTEGGSIDTYTFSSNYGVPPTIYKTSVEAITGATFDYLTTDAAGGGVIQDENGTAVAAADYAENSDYIFVFENPTTGTSNAWGYPIFDNGGNNVVGLLFAPGTGQGIGYTAVPADGFKFWVIPADLAGNANAALAKYAQTDLNPTPDANAKATAARTAQVLTITFTDGGLGYAIRPEFVISGGQRSAEDLATLNSNINSVRGQLNFNSAGSIINTSVSTALPANTFTADGIAAEPLALTISVERLQGIFNSEVNVFDLALNLNTGPFSGGVLIGSAGDGTAVAGPGAWGYFDEAQAPTTPEEMFNDLERIEFTAADRIGTNGAANADFKYITAPTYTVSFLGLDTGGNGVAVLDPNTADITSLSSNDNGSFPAGITFGGLATFVIPTNDDSYDPAGERFRTIGGPSSFEVFSGLTYIRDVNYGTGIELE